MSRKVNPWCTFHSIFRTRNAGLIAPGLMLASAAAMWNWMSDVEKARYRFQLTPANILQFHNQNNDITTQAQPPEVEQAPEDPIAQNLPAAAVEHVREEEMQVDFEAQRLKPAVVPTNALGDSRLIRVRDMQQLPVTVGELTTGESLVVDAGTKFFAVIGDRSSQQDNCKAISVARQIRN